MNFLKRLEGVFFNPRPTFEALAAKPKWVDALVVILVALIAFNLLASPYMIQDQLKLMKENEAALRESLGEETYNKRLLALEDPSSSLAVQTVIGTLLFSVAAFLIQALILLILGRFFSSQGAYAAVLSALVHASLIDTLLGNAVRFVLILTRKSAMQVSTGLAMFFPKMEVTSTPFILLKQVDLFQLWLFGVLAIGLAAVFKIKPQKALVLSGCLWFLKALVNVGLGLLQASFIR